MKYIVTLLVILLSISVTLATDSIYDDDPNCSAYNRAQFEYLTGMSYSDAEWLDLAGKDGLKRVCDFQVGLNPSNHIDYSVHYEKPAFVAMCLRAWGYYLPNPEKFVPVNWQGTPSVFREDMKLAEFYTLPISTDDRVYLVVYRQGNDAVVGVYSSTERYGDLEQGRCGIWRIKEYFN